MNFVTALKWFVAANLTVAAMVYVAVTLGIIEPVGAPVAGDPEEPGYISNPDEDPLASSPETDADSPNQPPVPPGEPAAPSPVMMLSEINNLADHLNEMFPTMWSRPNGNGNMQNKSLGRGCGAHLTHISNFQMSNGTYMTQEYTARFSFAEIVTVSPVSTIGNAQDVYDLSLQIAPEASGASRVIVTDNLQNPYDPTDRISLIQPTMERATKVRDALLALRERCLLLEMRETSG